MQRRRLGRTGHETSVAVLGGISFHFTPGDEAAELLQAALDGGVNAIDIAPGYGDAEVNLGAHLPPVRDAVFLSCKTAARTPDKGRAELERSLQRLGTDAVDVYQLHGLLTVADLDERAPVLEMILAARDEGLCRFVGTTGHDLETARAQAEALRRYDLDTVMVPVAPRVAAHAEYWSDLQKLLATCRERDLGVFAIKAASARRWSVPPEERTERTWYQPYVERPALERGIRFALSQPGVTAFCTPGEPTLLPMVFDIAASATPMDDQEQRTAVDEVRHEPSLFPMSA